MHTNEWTEFLRNHTAAFMVTAFLKACKTKRKTLFSNLVFFLKCDILFACSMQVLSPSGFILSSDHSNQTLNKDKQSV